MRPSARSGPEVSWPNGGVPTLEIGGSHVSAARIGIGTGGQTVLELRQRRQISPDGTLTELIAEFAAAARALDQRDGEPLAVAIPGPFDYRAGVGDYRDVGKFDALRGHRLREMLAARVPVTGPVSFINDAEAFLLGEWFSTRPGPARMVCLTLGTGIGSAFLVNGRLVNRGPNVPPNGHAHLLSIDGRPLEETISGRALLHAYHDSGDQPQLPDVHTLVQRVREGDQRAAATISTALTRLGAAFGPWLNRFAAAEVVFGGSMTRAWDVIGPAIVRGFEQTGAGGVTIRVVADTERSSLIGAAVHAVQHLAGGRAQA